MSLIGHYSLMTLLFLLGWVLINMRLQRIPFLPVAKRSNLGDACFSRASRNGSHPSSLSSRLVAVCDFFFSYIYGFFVCTPLSLFTLVYVVESLWLNILVKSLLLVTPALWHPCLEPMGPHLRKYCPLVLSFLVYFLSCPGPSVFVFFICCCNWFLMYLQKK
jgi:hypothetical protein